MFATASALRAGPDGLFEASFDPSWFQGPGVFGGLTAAVFARAFEAAGGGPPLASLTTQLCAPVQAGPARLEVRIERAGATTRYLSGRLLQEGKVQAHAVAVLARPRADDLDGGEDPMPAVPPAASLPPVPELPGLPVYLRWFELRFAAGELPFSGGEGTAAAWVRAEGDPPVDAALLCALLDVLPPSLLLRSRRPRPMGSVSMTMLLRNPRPALVPGTPLLVDVRHRGTRGGYSDEEGRVFAPDGAVLATVRQLYALVR